MMSKTKSGLILIAVGAGMYLTGQMLASLPQTAPAPPWTPVTLLTVFLGFSSMVVGLFGLFRLIVGLLSRKKQVIVESDAPPSEGVWPPAPKRPHYEEKENRR